MENPITISNFARQDHRNISHNGKVIQLTNGAINNPIFERKKIQVEFSPQAIVKASSTSQLDCFWFHLDIQSQIKDSSQVSYWMPLGHQSQNAQRSFANLASKIRAAASQLLREYLSGKFWTFISILSGGIAFRYCAIHFWRSRTRLMYLIYWWLFNNRDFGTFEVKNNGIPYRTAIANIVWSNLRSLQDGQANLTSHKVQQVS